MSILVYNVRVNGDMPEMAKVHRQPSLAIIGLEFGVSFKSQARGKTSKVRSAMQDCFDSSFKVSWHSEDKI